MLETETVNEGADTASLARQGNMCVDSTDPFSICVCGTRMLTRRIWISNM
jgi:hypothetical protein